MKINFKFETLGYIAAEFIFENKRIKIIHSSDYGDKFQELLNNIFNIYQIVNSNANENYFPYFFEVLWSDDSVNYRWEVKVASAHSDVEFKIYEESPTNVSNKVEVLNIDINFEYLFKNIYESLDLMFIEFGFVGYKNIWEVGNFPTFEYLTLKADLINLKLITISELTVDSWKQRLNIEDEIKLLIHLN